MKMPEGENSLNLARSNVRRVLEGPYIVVVVPTARRWLPGGMGFLLLASRSATCSSAGRGRRVRRKRQDQDRRGEKPGRIHPRSGIHWLHRSKN